MKKLNIHSPVTETVQYVVAGQKKYANNISAQNKEEKADTDYIQHTETRESVVSLRLAKVQDEVLSLMLQARTLMLPKVGYLKQYVFYSLQTKFYCNLLKTKPKNFQKLRLYKIFHKAGSSCLHVLAFWEERGHLELF